ncbi:hypothetical protein [Fibrobacter sp. UWEL]|nr:hypothetical protein [Fibrobacter sp. UWEL]
MSTQLSEDEIIQKISGNDLTIGSCASQALTYIGNKCGYDVRDFRGADSRWLFGQYTTSQKIAEAGGFVECDYNGFKIADRLLRNVEEGKEYFYTSGEHAAIIRKTGKKFEYLETQSKHIDENGFHPLTVNVLKKRFRTTKTRKLEGEKFLQKEVLIETSKISDSPNFKELLGYLNTDPKNQKREVPK